MMCSSENMSGKMFVNVLMVYSVRLELCVCTLKGFCFLILFSIFQVLYLSVFLLAYFIPYLLLIFHAL